MITEERGCDVAAFTSEDEVYDYLGGVFRIGMQDAALVEKLKPSGVVLRITYTDPDAVLTVDMANSEIYTGAGAGPDPNVELFMSADTGNRFWLGKVVLPVALAKGQVRAKGPVATLLKVLPLAKGLFGPYRESLEAKGRADLLSA
ncbi:MAG: SCP2 sterol-binding domain-containing protein [Pseudonocardia sp.]|nr:SCP2 sterol-binding domain-containing protein [Pseudonocardia sp.]